VRKAGEQIQLEGKPPFAVIVGNAAGVALQYKGKPVTLVPDSKSNVARLTLE
jgi:cytoskeleton protein RodZ